MRINFRCFNTFSKHLRGWLKHTCYLVIILTTSLYCIVPLFKAVEKHLRFVGLLSTQYKQSVNYPVPDSSYTSTMLSAGHLQTPLRSSKRLSGDSFLPNDLCKLTYYRFASDASLPWRVYATFCWALTNCLSQYDGCFA
uniref:Uncharacterized protein n=1 Tax=Schistosoma haematobium TaxID=6185 RepID=A0A095B2J0_SCHHA